jgi:hypothetical protein
MTIASTSEKEASKARTLRDVYDQLVAPFPPELVELRPGATTKDGKRALALPYVDMRDYQNRLDEVCGPDGWSVSYRPFGDRVAVICTLTILGVTREDVGEANPADENAATIAVAQAFKRTCTGFGLGRYLYSLPQVWADYDPARKVFINVEATVREMYAKAGIKLDSPRNLAAEPRASSEQKAEIATLIETLLQNGVFSSTQEAQAHFRKQTGVTSRDQLTAAQARDYIAALEKLRPKSL